MSKRQSQVMLICYLFGLFQAELPDILVTLYIHILVINQLDLECTFVILNEFKDLNSTPKIFVGGRYQMAKPFVPLDFAN